MSNPAEEPKTPPPAQDSGFAIRLSILVGLLVLALVAFAFDRVAWSQAKEAYDLLTKIPKDEKYQKETITPKQIHEILGREPSIAAQPGDEPETVEEVFQWQRGMPFRTYDVIVSYRKGSKHPLIFSTVRSVGIEEGEELPPPAPGHDGPPAALPPGPPPSRGGTDENPMRPPMDAPQPSDPMPMPATDPAPADKPTS